MAELPELRLERFYYGHLIDQHNRKSATPGVIARTPGCSPECVTECLRVAKLVPPRPPETSDEMPGALGLFRGETSDFILVKAQQNAAGIAQVLYAPTSAALLRHLAGNVLVFQSFAMTGMPTFAHPKHDLQPLDFAQAASLSPDIQTNALLKLLLFCQDSFKTLEGILAGLVQGWPLAVVNSPPSLEKRLLFVQGLLSLLPQPARIGITFATHVAQPDQVQVQIKFTSQSTPPDRHMVYDWGAGNLLTSPPDDSYSRYMVAQLRLDPSLVIEQTAELSRTTVWRAQHRDNLDRALAWVSRRGALDQTVRDGQPADRQLVADVLHQDPTLSDDLRLAYTRHLLAFALALDEPASADVVPAVAATHPEIARAITEQLRAALTEHAPTVYALLERWLLRVPEAADLGWQTLLHAAGRHYIGELIRQKQHQNVLAMLKHIQNARPVLGWKKAMSHLIITAQPAAHSNPELANMLFLLAIKTMPAGELHRLLGDKAFTTHLPPATQTALLYLEPEPRHPAPPHVLADGARVFTGGHRMWVLARLVEWAMYLQRTELVDTAALQALLVMAQSPQADQFEPLIRHILDDFSVASNIAVLTPPGPRILVQLMLLAGDYDQAIGMLEFYQTSLFGVERLAEFNQLVGEVFLKTPLEPAQLGKALNYLEGSQVRPEPRAAIYANALHNRQWAPNQEHAARRLTTLIFNDNNLIGVIGHEDVLKLLEFYANTRNALDALRVGAALVEHTLRMGMEGAVLIMRMWPSLTWNSEMVEAALELLRRFLRGAPLDEVPALIAYFEDELGAETAEMFRATYLLRLIMDGDDLLHFAEEIHIAASLLQDITAAYHAGKELPPNHRLRRDLDTMTGGLSNQDREQVASNLLTIMHLVFETGQATARRRGRQGADPRLIQGQTAPQDGAEFLLFCGAHFAGHQAHALDLERESMAHVFGNRSAAMFLRETTSIARLLTGLQAAFPPDAPPHIAPGALAAELDSLWNSLSLYNQRQIHDQLAHGCQQLGEVIALMASEASDRVLSDGGLGRQLETGQRQPRKALEALRWVHGYFARRHVRTRT